MLMPENDIANYREFIDWLIGVNESYDKIPLLISRNILLKKYYKTPSAELYKIKDDAISNLCIRPQYCLVLRAANLIFQLYYPMYIGYDPTAKMDLELLPDVVVHNGSATYKIFNLADQEQSLDEVLKFSFDN